MRFPSLVIAAALSLATLVVPASAAPPASECTKTDTGYTCMYGPITVEPGMNIAEGPVAAPGEAGYITSARATLVDADGAKLQHHLAHLHHAVWLNPSKDDLTCDIPADRFFATGKERTPFALPSGYGYYWNNQPASGYEYLGPIWAMTAHIDGMHGDQQAYIKLKLGFTPATTATLTDVQMVWLDVRNCTDSEYDIARGSGRRGLHRERWDYTMPVGGSFITLGGHLHDGGRKLVLRNATTDSHIFTSRASYDLRREPDYLTGMSSYSGLPGFEVNAGDRLRLTAVYDSTRALKGVMGIMVGALAPAPDPPADPM